MKMNNALLVIVGPTAVGKTDVAIEIAKRFNAEIISADSRYFYRGMDIGTAKPTIEERQDIPHYLIDITNPDETWSLSIFQKEATKHIKEIQSRGKLPILVGGTGQYIHAVLQGWDMPAQEPDIRFRNILEEWGKEIGALALYEKLKIIDPEAASHIEYQNLRRTIRALEVIFLTGRKFSSQRQKRGSSFSYLMIGLKRPRPELYERIDRRIEKMVKEGMVEEVKTLLDAHYSPALASMSAIGYREIVEYIQGNMSLDEAVVQMKRLTRQYVRRQANWFKESDPDIHWFEMKDGVVDTIEEFLNRDTGWINQSMSTDKTTAL
ncbi:MAG: tRNA (adenosine(37)-N6)-dimethylallyltransferase MiaA [Anaerolineae bacterium]|nr:tRNA (adenosine(37)-N6)-dimethylallyltransferase MiaA [Anaerolineae bacterium]